MKLLFFISILSLSCQPLPKEDIVLKNNKANIDTSWDVVDTVLQNKIIDTLSKLSFIKESNTFIDSISNHKQGIAFLMDTVSGGDIWIQAGYNRKERFITGFQIYVNPTTMDIKIYDAANDRKLSIKEFEKINK